MSFPIKLKAGASPHFSSRAEELDNETFDVAIIGAGIVGSCIARDCARRGFRTVVLDKGDFSSGTSGATSKLVHGGVRYLKNFEFWLVRQALHERRIWGHIGRHLVRPMPFLLSLGGGRGAAMLTATALTLYDLLALHLNGAVSAGNRTSGHRWLNSDEAICLEPVLRNRPDREAFLYYDYQMVSPERLGLECLLDAEAFGASAMNYTETFAMLKTHRGAVVGVRVLDHLRGTESEIRARYIVNATGPWSDLFLDKVAQIEPPFTLTRAKGVHLICRPFLRQHAVALSEQGRHLFAIPWRGRTLVGTTDSRFSGSPDNVRAEPTEITQLLSSFNGMFSRNVVCEEDVLFAYAGVRPLLCKSRGTGETYSESRQARIVDHGRIGGPTNLFSAVGGKWTIARAMAQSITDVLVQRSGRRMRCCDTAYAPLPGAVAIPQSVEPVQPACISQLQEHYGALAAQVVSCADGSQALLERITPFIPHIWAEIVHAARFEGAAKLEDVLFRRTSIGQLGSLPERELQKAARLLGTELGWDAARAQSEVAAAKARWTSASGNL